jgi:CBS domain-containing protein
MTSIQDIKVLPSTPLDVALTTMSTHRVSALPVVDETETLQGIITAYGIMQVWKSSPMPLNNLIASTSMEQVHKMRPEPLVIDDDLYDHVDSFISSTHHNLFIINNEKERKALGKVAKVELMQHLLLLGKPYILVKEIELKLKAIIRHAYQDDVKINEAIANLSNSSKDNYTKALKMVKKLCADKGFQVPESELEDYARKTFPIKPSTRTLKDLTFSELMQLVQNQAAWPEIEQLFPPYDMPGWTKRVQPVLGARNDAFHFRKEIDQPLIDELTTYADWQEACKIPQPAISVTQLITPPHSEAEVTPLHSEAEITTGFISLMQQLDNGKRANSLVTLSLSMIRNGVTISLPPESETEPNWWKTDSLYTRQWTQKGWVVVDADLQGGLIIFSANA